jgi:hypothetical protein
MSTLDLINAIEAGNSVDIEAQFNDIMANKVSDRLDAMRTDMSQNMFKTPGEPEEDFDAETEFTSEEDFEPEFESENTEQNE